MGHTPLKIAPSNGGFGPHHLIYDSWAHPRAHLSPQYKQHLDRFSHFCTAHCRVSLRFTISHPFPPQNCPFQWGDVDPPSNTQFLGPTNISIHTASRLLQPLCRAHYCNRQTDRPRYSDCKQQTVMQYCDAPMQPNNKQWQVGKYCKDHLRCIVIGIEMS